MTKLYLSACMLVAAVAVVAAQPDVADSRQKPPPPRILTETTNFASQLAVELAAPPDAAGIVYTLDGSAPTLESPRYRAPIDLGQTTTVKARSISRGSPPVLSETIARHFNRIRVRPVKEVRINFQPPNAPKPMGYLLDTGQPFRTLEGGAGFGWNQDNRQSAFERHKNPDPLDDTLVLFADDTVWEIGVHDGDYQLTICIGDAAEACRNQTLFAEGEVFCRGIDLQSGQFKVLSRVVTIKDGLLSLSAHNATNESERARICWLDIRPPRR